MRRSGDKFFETECYVVIQFEPSLSASGGEGAALYRETLRSNFMITDKIHKNCCALRCWFLYDECGILLDQTNLIIRYH